MELLMPSFLATRNRTLQLLNIESTELEAVEIMICSTLEFKGWRFGRTASRVPSALRSATPWSTTTVFDHFRFALIHVTKKSVLTSWKRSAKGLP
jgi:hypothetical protein